MCLQVVSASLGYMHLFVDLLSVYLGGPLLHEGSFQGSTTVVWQQVGCALTVCASRL